MVKTLVLRNRPNLKVFKQEQLLTNVTAIFVKALCPFNTIINAGEVPALKIEGYFTRVTIDYLKCYSQSKDNKFLQIKKMKRFIESLQKILLKK